MFSNDIISWSVESGEIASTNPEAIIERIRLNNLRESTVTVVLVGAQTWRRRYVDWEIQASLRHTSFSGRSGLLGILLPTYPGFLKNEYYPHTIPPRLYDNLVPHQPQAPTYASIIRWSEDPEVVRKWIHYVFEAREKILPVNSRPMLTGNLGADHW